MTCAETQAASSPILSEPLKDGLLFLEGGGGKETIYNFGLVSVLYAVKFCLVLIVALRLQINTVLCI